MSPRIQIMLDNYSGHYFPGSPIQGRALVTMDSSVSIRGIRVAVKCKEHTEWWGTETYYNNVSKRNHTRRVLLRGDGEVFNIMTWVHGNGSSSASLPPGQHTYPFAITLPTNVPGSYRSNEGHITYKVKATIDRIMALDSTAEVFISVVSPVDLNLYATPVDLVPVRHSDEKTICCCCCAEGPISMDVEVPKNTLIPGEEVEIKARVVNMSKSNIEGVIFKLTQKIHYKVTYPRRDQQTQKILLFNAGGGGVGAHGENTYIFKVVVPRQALLPNFASCNLFSVSYQYKVIAQLESMHRNLTIKVYPKLGHIPLGPTPAPFVASGSSGEPAPSAPPATVVNSKETNQDQNTYRELPPSYDEVFRSQTG